MALMEDGVRAMGISDQSTSNTPKTSRSDDLGTLLREGPANSPGELVDPAIPRGWYDGPVDAAGVRHRARVQRLRRAQELVAPARPAPDDAPPAKRARADDAPPRVEGGAG